MNGGPQPPALEREDIARFVRDGFIRIEGAFSREAAVECSRQIAARGRIDLADPSTWTQPVVRIVGAGDPVFADVINTPKLHAAYDDVVGPGRWVPRNNVGLVVVRFPHAEDPGDAGWHIEASYAAGSEQRVNVFSRDRALLLLLLLSDVGEDDAPTRVRVGSHLLVPPQLREAGSAGMSSFGVATDTAEMEACPVAMVTGHAGDVYLCHPFLVHSATWPHRGTTPRFMAQPALSPSRPFEYERATGQYSPVEGAIRVGLGLETLDEAAGTRLAARADGAQNGPQMAADRPD
jgi:hypothetical protein